MVLTAGHEHDSRTVPALLENLAADTVVVADLAHDAGSIKAMIEERDAAPNAGRESHPHTGVLLLARVLIAKGIASSGFFCRVKQFRSVASRCGKPAAYYLVKLVVIRPCLFARLTCPRPGKH